MGGDAPVIEDGLEHLWDDALASMQKGRSNAVCRRMQGDVERVCHECRRRLPRVDVLQCGCVTQALSLQFDEALDLYRARANLAHRIRYSSKWL